MPTHVEAAGDGALFQECNGLIVQLTADDPRIQRVLKFIDQHLDRPIGLGELAAEAAVERKHLSRLFKRKTGWHCTVLIRHLRLSRAKELLRTRRGSITEVAAEVGWDVRTLQRAIRGDTGVTARALRDASPLA